MPAGIEPAVMQDRGLGVVRGKQQLEPRAFCLGELGELPVVRRERRIAVADPRPSIASALADLACPPVGVPRLAGADGR